VAKQPNHEAAALPAVRTRRAYFDCRYGQLHVRTAFPTTGGFDEGVTLFCLHALDGSSRAFTGFLPQMAADRSVYAPDLPGCGESDAAPGRSLAESAQAVADLAADLRLRQIDVLGFRFGAGVALALAALRPDLVRRLVVIGPPPLEPLPEITQESLVLRVRLGVADDCQWTRGVLTRATFIDVDDYSGTLFDALPQAVGARIGAFLRT
jgi:pimeloyl-ACP methyl ester carboxylesterase